MVEHLGLMENSHIPRISYFTNMSPKKTQDVCECNGQASFKTFILHTFYSCLQFDLNPFHLFHFQLQRYFSMGNIKLPCHLFI